MKIPYQQLLSCAVFYLLCTPYSSSQTSKNVLFIIADDFNHWMSEIGYYPQAITPNLDALAQKGVLFTNAFSPSAICNPSRNAMMSGYRPNTTGHYQNAQGYVRYRPGFANIKTLNQYFSEQAYYTYAGGKIYHPAAMGGVESDAVHWSGLYTVGGNASPGGDLVNWEADNHYNLGWSIGDFDLNTAGDTKLANHMAQFVQNYSAANHQGKPFFAAVGFFRPHLPWNLHRQFWDLYDEDTLEIPQGYLANDLDDHVGQNTTLHQEIVSEGKWKEGIRAYLAGLSYADYNVGIVLDALENSPHKDNTVIVFLGDHGWHLGEKSIWDKAHHYQHAYHTSLVIYDPSAEGNRSKCLKPVSLQDLYPTLVEIAGLEPKTDIEGESLVPLLADPQDPNWSKPVIMTNWGNNAVRTEEYRMFVHPVEAQLYRIDQDPWEFTNLYEQPGYNSVIASLNNQIAQINQVGQDLRAKLLNNYQFTPDLNILPGIVEAENYDEGVNNHSYFDKSPNNTGGRFREDNVDIYSGSGASGSYYLGNLEDGEWLTYTLYEVPRALYDIQFRITNVNATPGQEIEIFLGTKSLGSLAIPGTSSNNDWVYATLPNVYLDTKRSRIMKVHIKGGNFRLDYMKFATSNTSSCTSSSNLARNRPTNQSSTYGLGLSSYAVDGNSTGTSPWTADLQHTQNEFQPWWEVDLGTLQRVEQVNLYNRSGSYQNRLKNFYVLISNTAFPSGASLDELLNSRSIQKTYFPGTASSLERLFPDAQGRFVRVQLLESGILHMAEVQVIGCSTGSDPCVGTADVSIAPAGPFTSNQGVQQLQASPSGGTWSGAAGTNGSFDPGQGAGSYEVSYTVDFGNGCIKVANQTILVNSQQDGGECTTSSNLSRNRPASQSSTYGFGLAGYAVDGNTTGSSPWTANLQHTQTESQPWWEVDLGAIHQIDQVNLYNRSDSYQDRLHNFYVLTSNVAFPQGASLNTLLNDVSIGKTQFTGTASFFESLTIGEQGRFVRVQLASSGILHMSEVEVMGCEISSTPCPDNLALNRSSSQSSTYAIGLSSHAVDGNTQGSSPWSADLQHTEVEREPWWQVDLGQQADIEQIKLFNRTDCCKIRLEDFYIFVSKVAFTNGASLADLLNSSQVNSYFFSGAVDEQATIPFPVSGRHVRIQLTSANLPLHMAEVQVIGCYSSESSLRLEGMDQQSANEVNFTNPPLLTISPNPSQGGDHIKVSCLHAPDPVFDLELLSLTGKKIHLFKDVRIKEELSISLSGLPSGIYLLRAYGMEWSASRRLVLK